MSNQGLTPEQGRRLLRIASGTAVGLLVLIGGVIGFTWLSMTLMGLDFDDPPTSGYLVLNLIGSGLAGLLGGLVSATMARSLVPPLFLALLTLAMGAIAGTGAAAAGQPAWYPFAVTAVGAAMVLGGGLLVRRTRGRSHHPEAADTAPPRG